MEILCIWAQISMCTPSMRIRLVFHWQRATSHGSSHSSLDGGVITTSSSKNNYSDSEVKKWLKGDFSLNHCKSVGFSIRASIIHYTILGKGH